MGKYYRNGRLWSGDTFLATGTRTLAAATESDIWSGSNATRPIPDNEQLRLVSSSAQDDAGIPAVTDVWTVTVGGTADAGDVARITINGTNFDYAVAAGATTAIVATGLGNAVNNGSTEVWDVTPTGGYDLNDTFRITINAIDYDFVCGAAETTATVCAGLTAAVNAGGGDPLYTAVDATAFVRLTAKVGGTCPNVSASVPVDANSDATLTATAVTTGVAADTNYTASVLASAVTLTNTATGATADTVASSYPVDPGTDSTCTAVHTTTGADATTGTGINTVSISYLDGSGVRQTEVINLNGVGAVTTTATTVTAILGVSATVIGASGGAVGTVSISNTAATSTFEVIAAGASSTTSAAYLVPAANQAFVTALHVSAGATATTVKLKSDCNPATGAIVANGAFVWHTTIVGTDPATISPLTPLGPLPAGAKVWLTATHATGTACQGTIEGFLEPA